MYFPPMAVILEGGCRVSQMREGAPINFGTLFIWDQIGRADGAQAISLCVMEFWPGLSPTLINEDCDQILYALESGLGLERASADGAESRRNRNETVASIAIDGDRFEISSDTGIYIRPNQSFAIDNKSRDPVVLISVQCPIPPHLLRFSETPLPA